MIDMGTDNFEDYEKQNKILRYNTKIFLETYKIYVLFKNQNSYKYCDKSLTYLIPSMFYIAGLCNAERRTQEEIAKTFNTNVARIRKGYRIVKKSLNIDVPA